MFKFPWKSKKSRVGEQLCAEISRLEGEMQEQLDFQTLRQLLDVYSVSSTQRAIEHFEAARDSRYKQINDRMQAVLARADVRRLIARPADSPRPNKLFKTTPLRPVDRSASLRIHTEEGVEGDDSLGASAFSLSALSPPAGTVQSFIDSGLSLSASTSQKLFEDIQNQQSILRGKLATRIKRKSETKFSSGSIGDGFELSTSQGNIRESDKSGGPKKKVFEEELEVLLEKLVQEKVERTAEINRKYEEQIREIAGAGCSGIILKVIEQVKAAQQKELQDIASDFETHRKAAISALRKECQVVY